CSSEFTPDSRNSPLLSPTSFKKFCAGDKEPYSFFYNEKIDFMDVGAYSDLNSGISNASLADSMMPLGHLRPSCIDLSADMLSLPFELTSDPDQKRKAEGSSGKFSVPTSPVVKSPAPSHTEHEHQEEPELCDPRPTQSPTIFETLTQAGVDWCRVCGTTEGVNWRSGPWGKRT